MKWRKKRPANEEAEPSALSAGKPGVDDDEKAKGGLGIVECLPSAWRHGWLPGWLLVVATVLVYQPAWQGRFVWDDSLHITDNQMLVEPGGWKQIWSSPDSPQYYPLVFTSFRIERSLWGLNPTGYHWVNLLLHAASAVLVWRVLRRLSVPGAWLAAAVFALHPVNVESVAWISQRKNTLAMLFYLLSLLLYLRSDPERPGPNLESQRLWYWLSLLAFVLALLSKTAVAPLPLVLLLLAWWRRGRVTGRDVWRSAPFFAAALVLGLVTVWFERHQTEGFEVVRDDSFWSRLAVAGQAVWFYLYKAVLPLNLMPIYPRWPIGATNAWSYVPGLLVAGAILLGWRYRRSWGKAWLVCLGYYVVMLLPVLGFVNIGFMRYSLVADHWQYFSILGPIALVSAGVALARGIRSPKSEVQSAKTPSPHQTDPSPLPSPLPKGRGGIPVGAGLGVAMVLALGGLTWQQSAIYAGPETFWRAVLATNPGCWRAYYIFAGSLSEQGRLDEAIAHYQKALEIQPDCVFAHNDLGNTLRQKGQVREALVQYRKALELQPDLAWANYSLGAILLQQGQVDEAIAQFQRALQMRLLIYKTPITAPSVRAQIQYLLGCALARKGLAEEAITHYREALALKPDYAEAHYQLAVVLLARGEAAEASRHYREAIRLKPDWAEALNNLSWLLATQPEARFRNGQEAVALAARGVALTHTNDAKLLDTLAAAYAEAGRFEDAVKTTEELRALAAAAHDTKAVDTARQRLELYQAGKPYRDEP